MEGLISELFKADTAAIKRASIELKKAFERPETISELYGLMISSDESAIRLYAAALLRKCLTMPSRWLMVPWENQLYIKQGLLNAIMQEPERPVRTAIAQLIGALGRHESIKNDPWISDVLEYLCNCCCSPDLKQCNLGSSIIAILADTMTDQLKPCLESMCKMFTSVFLVTDPSGDMGSLIIFNIITCMKSLLPLVMGHDFAEQTYENAIPIFIKTMREFAIQTDTEKFDSTVGILKKMATSNTSKLIKPHTRLLLNFCLELASNASFNSCVGMTTVSFINCLLKLKNNLINDQMIQPLVQLLFKLMVSEVEELEGEQCLIDGDESNPLAIATRTMHTVGRLAKQEIFIPALEALLASSLNSNNPLLVRASFLSMSVVAQVHPQLIRENSLGSFVKAVMSGIAQSNAIVQNAAFYVLEEFSKDLQPGIIEYTSLILQTLISFLHEYWNDGGEVTYRNHLFRTLVAYCQNLGDMLLPYLPRLMEELFGALTTSRSIHLNELVLRAIVSLANVAKANMFPFLNQLNDILRRFLEETEDVNIIALRKETIDTVAALATAVGKQHFMPFADDIINYSLHVLHDTNDPGIRAAIYKVFAAFAGIVNEAMGSVYLRILDNLYKSIKECIVSSIDSDFDHVDDDMCIISIAIFDGEKTINHDVINSYLEEKKDAILALKEFSEHTGASFIPYLLVSYKNVISMIHHPNEEIRIASTKTLTIMMLSMYDHYDIQSVSTVFTKLVRKLRAIIRDNEEFTAPIVAFESYVVLLKIFRNRLANAEEEKAIDTMFKCINDVVMRRLACNYAVLHVGDEDEELMETIKERDTLEKAVVHLFPMLASAVSTEKFAEYFEQLCPIIDKKLYTYNTEYDKKWRLLAYTLLGECFQYLKQYSSNYFNRFFGLMIKDLNDPSDIIRKYAFAGLGQLVLYSGEKSYGAFHPILSEIYQATTKEVNPAVRDEICIAIARIIMTNYLLVPLPYFLGVLLDHLPLRVNFEQNKTIFECFHMLYNHARHLVSSHIEKILLFAIHVLLRNEYNHYMVVALIKQIQVHYPRNYFVVANSSPQIAVFLQML